MTFAAGERQPFGRRDLPHDHVARKSNHDCSPWAHISMVRYIGFWISNCFVELEYADAVHTRCNGMNRTDEAPQSSTGPGV